MKVLILGLILSVALVSFIFIMVRSISNFEYDLSNKNKYCRPDENDRKYNDYSNAHISLNNLYGKLLEIEGKKNKLTQEYIEKLNKYKDYSIKLHNDVNDLNECKFWCSYTNTANWNTYGNCTCIQGYGDKNINISDGKVLCGENPQNKEVQNYTEKVDKSGNQFSNFIKDFRLSPKP